MKKWLVALAVVFIVFGCGVEAFALDGKQIIETHKQRHEVDSANDSIIMLLIDKKGQRKTRSIKRYGKRFADGLRRSLLVFTGPKDLKGTALLTWELADDQHKQWLYLPGQKSLQRIAASAKRSSFMGSDFIFEDLQPDAIDQFTYSAPTTEELDGHPCYVVEVTPASAQKAKDSAYGKRVVYVRQDIFFTVKIDFFDKRGRLIKTQTNHDLVNLTGDVWYAQKVLMTHHKKKHKTLMGVKSKEINVALEDKIFSEAHVLSGRHVR